MSNNRKIQITVDGVVITGIVRCRDNEEIVEITAPFTCWRTSRFIRWHIVRASRCVRVKSSKQPDAERMLQMLYRLCNVLEENSPLAVESFEEVEERIAALHAEGLVNDGMFEANRQALRVLHVDGGLNEQEYHETICRLRIRHSQYHHKRSQILDRWFREMFTEPIEDDGLRDQIIRYLKHKNRMALDHQGKQQFGGVDVESVRTKPIVDSVKSE